MSKLLTVRLDDQTFTAVERLRKRLRRPRNAVLKDAIATYARLRESQTRDAELFHATRRIRFHALRELADLDAVQDLVE